MAGGPADGFGSHDLGGVYYAIVTQNDDKEGPGGRVKVRYPWLQDGDRDQSYWAPLVVPMIGPAFGTYTVPEVEDSVMVMFLAGDMNHPVVVGGGWSSVDPPPESNDDGKNSFRLIKSRAGHRLIFDDTSSVKVVVSDMGDRHLLGVGELAAQGSSPNAVDAQAMGSSRGIAVTASSGTLNVWCPKGKLTVRARDVEVTAADGADVRGGTVYLKGTGGATMSAVGSGKYQGATIKLGGG